jgi:mono/diheme cytochrome c family protein
MQPPLIGSKRLSGADDKHIARLMLQGSEWVEDPEYTNRMASFSFLSDQDIALALNYVKARFGQTTDTLTAVEVGDLRNQLKN